MVNITALQRIRAVLSRPLSSHNKTALGFIAIGLAVALVAALLGVKMLGVGYRHYTAQFLQAASLRPGNIITVSGIPVGTVTSTKLAGDHIEAGLQVRDDITLGADTKAIIKITTILGSRYLEIRPGHHGVLPNNTIDLAHSEVPYDLQSTLNDATSTFEQVDADKIASSLAVLGKQLDGLPGVVPQAMSNIHRLSSSIAVRRSQIGTLLSSVATVTNTLHQQQSGLGALVRQGRDLVGDFVARQAAFHAMIKGITEFTEFLRKVTVVDQTDVDDLLAELSTLTGMLAHHDDLFRNLLQVQPVGMRNLTNALGTGNALDVTLPGGLLVDSWMCAVSARAKQFNMIEYFKDCK
ncbi:MCE family protein [Mycobacteroides chelonae]|uniref:MCE family protein n=1 Tax=Mycobacteroides chelonae TaxID=1774 RepID=UPI0008A8E4CA|nr:MCE family protein [Mycobacteroides chelonae]OHU32939.1 mammalian cell entry protein [Mycobacteroides chelonae]